MLNLEITNRTYQNTCGTNFWAYHGLLVIVFVLVLVLVMVFAFTFAK